MYPWLFVWAPQYQFPWSGAVKQEISPETIWDAIPANAGDGAVEEDVFKHAASYGKQIGILADIVQSLTDEVAGKPRTEQAVHAVAQLNMTMKDVEAIKARHKRQRIDAAVAVLRELQPSELTPIIARLRAET